MKDTERWRLVREVSLKLIVRGVPRAGRGQRIYEEIQREHEERVKAVLAELARRRAALEAMRRYGL